MTSSGDTGDIRELYLAGQRRWPSVSLAFDTFAAHCARTADDSASPPLEGVSLYLCCACVAREPSALHAFQSENAGVAEAAIRRVDGDEDFVRDSLQELWKRLLLGDQAKLRSYSGRGPLQAWVRVAATRLALDRRRADTRHAKHEVVLPESLASSEVSPETSALKARFGRAFQDALRQAVAELTQQERNVLRMHVIGRCSIDEIGLAYAVHRATAARWIERARTKIYEQVRQVLCAGHRLTASEFRSLATLLGDEKELSLGFGSTSLVSTAAASRGSVA
jgi:RNA polymerase sigma-70 factor (ECF subfamily)